MDYEEKYKKTLEKARKELQACGSVDCDAAKQIFRFFPELAESEDEKIRKELIDFVKSRLAGFPQCEKFISWLEKQGKPNTYWEPTEEQYDALDYAYNSCPDTERGNYYEGVLSTLIDDLHRLEKQQKASKVEAAMRDLEQKAKAFTEAHKGETSDEILAQMRGEGWSEDDSEDERIRKALIRFHKSTIDVDGIKGEDILAWLEKQGEQKPAWSEEDERKLRILIAMCDETKGDSVTYSTMYREMEELKTWLKFLKDGYTWKPSDEQMNNK